MELEHVTHDFPPIYNGESRILMLGTMPSPKSREVGFYYGHPRNRFWKVVSDVCGEALPVTKEEKILFALKNKIACMSECSKIRFISLGIGFLILLSSAPLISQPANTSHTAIFTTGTKAARLYKKYCYPQTGIQAISLPSTSPANCRMSYEELYDAYAVIKKYL